MDYELPKLECKRCGHKWTPRKEERPITCPKCKSPYWDKNRKRNLEQRIIHMKDLKPLCTEICADPDLVEVLDSRKETEKIRQRERIRIANCPLKKKYRCQWEKET